MFLKPSLEVFTVYLPFFLNFVCKKIKDWLISPIIDFRWLKYQPVLVREDQNTVVSPPYEKGVCHDQPLIFALALTTVCHT